MPKDPFLGRSNKTPGMCSACRDTHSLTKRRFFISSHKQADGSKRWNTVKVKLGLSCPGAWTDLFTEGIRGGSCKFWRNWKIPLFKGSLVFYRFMALYYGKQHRMHFVGSWKLTNHIRLKSSSIKLSWITPRDSPLRIDKSTASRGEKIIHSLERERESAA